MRAFNLLYFLIKILAIFGAVALILVSLAFLLLYFSTFNLLGIILAAALIFVEEYILNWLINNYY